MSVTLLGVRHHGPGSARAVRDTLASLRPDAVLVEGPPEADGLVAMLRYPGLVPPVALLAYAADDPARASFWPFAEFSPEWQALRWAVDADVPVRFFDLPATHMMAIRDADDASDDDGRSGDADDDLEVPAPRNAAAAAGAAAVDASPEALVGDPLAVLAAAAGYDDPERWWDDVVESRLDGVAPFDAVAEAMAELRRAMPADRLGRRYRENEERREAYMRTVLRQTLKAGAERVAVVCGAWHVPALATLPPAAHDARTLRGLPKRKVVTTWVPWTQSRLAAGSGYGAGVQSPGWYAHLFTAPDRPVTRWFVEVARELRTHDLPVSSAHVIEAVRLAESLATLRGRPLAGIAEVQEATLAVLCDGDTAALDFVTRNLVVGEALGSVPADAPSVPVAEDLRREARRLRLKVDPVERGIDVDLRDANGLDRSRLLHRLTALDVPWGVPTADTRRATGTFRETWALRWDPSLEVSLVEASRWGTTVRSAAGARILHRARAEAAALADVTAAVEEALLADVGEVFDDVVDVLADRSAVVTDVPALMAAVPALARSLRYGDVRRTPVASLRAVVEVMLLRACVGLPVAVTGLDDSAAEDLRTALDGVAGAVAILDDETLRDAWLDALLGVSEREDVHGLLAGRITRLLTDAGRLPPQQTQRRLALVLTVGTAPAQAAAYVEGFFAGGGLLLVHDTALLDVVDRWLLDVPADTFPEVLPLLRRTFGSFAAPERRAVLDRVAGLGAGRATAAAPSDGIDEARAQRVVPVVHELLGWSR